MRNTKLKKTSFNGCEVILDFFLVKITSRTQNEFARCSWFCVFRMLIFNVFH